MTNATATHRKLVTIELAKVVDNPWQPRASLDPEYIKEIAASIESLGLLSPPMVRLVEGSYQLAFGHYRVAALRTLDRHFAEMELCDLTDTDMAVIALAENAKRKDVAPIEQYRAWKKALEIEGMSVQLLADKVGLDRSTVSNNLRLLTLPAAVLQQVDGGSLSAHGAREFLCLMGSDGHFHDDITKQVLDRLTVGPPDWRVARIRAEIDDAVTRRPVSEWRRLFKEHPGGSHVASPEFDTQRFDQEHAAKVHTLPADDWEGRQSYEPYARGRVRKELTRPWTCATSDLGEGAERRKDRRACLNRQN